MFRPKYFIYFPLALAVLTLVWLLFIYLTVFIPKGNTHITKGCYSEYSWNSTSIKRFEIDYEKRALTLQKHVESLAERELQQNTLLTEIENLKISLEKQLNASKLRFKYDANTPYIYAITPTYERLTQKADLTRLCQTFKHVLNFHWIIVEDAPLKRDLIKRFLVKCGVKYTHLAVRTRTSLQRGKNDPRWKKSRGVEQRNAGLTWLRENIERRTANGVVYFIDDDNTYDLELFEQMRTTKKVSVWPVGLVGGLKWEGPVCKNGKVIKFWTTWEVKRAFPLDMAGFAINIKLLLDNPSAMMDVDARQGYLETSLLTLLVTRDELEPLADDCKKILVWHTQTTEPRLKEEIKLQKIGKQSDPSIEV